MNGSLSNSIIIAITILFRLLSVIVIMEKKYIYEKIDFRIKKDRYKKKRGTGLTLFIVWDNQRRERERERGGKKERKGGKLEFLKTFLNFQKEFPHFVTSFFVL